jgi:Carboxypeptidase regulatory-like domain
VRRRFWVGTLALLMLATVAGRAQDKALLTGDVVNDQDQPMAGVLVTLQNDQLGVKKTFTTESDGTYVFAFVGPADGYHIVATDANGDSFAPGQVQLTVQVGEHRYILPSFIEEPKKAAALSPQLFPAPPARAVVVAVRSHAASDTSWSLATVVPGSHANPALLRAVSFQVLPFRTLGDFDALPGAGPRVPQSQTGAQGSGSPSGTPGPGAQPVLSGSQRPLVLENLSTAMSDVITSARLRTLPLYNRNFLALGLLASSTFNVPAGSVLQGATFGVSGQRLTSNDFLLDGMDNVASGNNQAIPFQVNDAIQEFRVVYATSDAQYGRSTGGVVNVVTQRGTNTLHGSVFGFFGSDSLNAASPISVYSGSGLDQAASYAGAYVPTNAQSVGLATDVYLPQNYNQYAATAQVQGLPCTTPGAMKGSPDCYQKFDPASILSGHNSFTQPFSSQQFGARAGGEFLKKWYWFGDYEGTRINNPNPIFDRVPTAFDLSREQALFPQGNQSAKIAHDLLALYPQSNVVGVPGALEFYQGQAPNYTNVDNYMVRFDFNQSAKSEWSFRYNIQDLHQLHDDSLPSSSVYPGNGSNRSVLNQNLALTFTHSFSDKLINEARIGFTRFQVLETPQDQSFNPASVGLSSGPLSTFLLAGLDTQYSGAKPGVNGALGGWADSAWIPSASQNPPSSSPLISPSTDGLFPFPRLGAPLDSPGQRRDTAEEYLDNVSLIRGRHSVKFGVEFRNLQDIFINDAFSRGIVASGNIGEFDSDSEGCNSPGCVVPAFTNPSFDYSLKQQAPYRGEFNSYVAAGYLQDTWRIKSHFALNLGLRYEYFSPPKEANDQIWNYDPAANGLVQESHSNVVDPFGYPCSTGFGAAAFIYPAVPLYLPWRCQTTGNGSFLHANTAQFEPRIGVLWSNADSSTVIRAGFGIFYDQLPTSQIARLMFNRPTQLNIKTPQAVYGQNFNSFYCGSAVLGQPPGQCGFGNTSLNGLNLGTAAYQAAAEPFGISAVDANRMNSPQSRQASFSVQHLFDPKLSLQIGYVGNFMRQLSTVSNTGFNNEWFCTNSAGAQYPSMPASNASNCDSFSYFPIFTLADRGYGSYNALVLEVRTSGWHGLQAGASYTWSNALDNASQSDFSLIPTSLFTQLYGFQFYGLGNPSVFGLGNTTQFSNSSIKITPGAYTQNVGALTGLLSEGITTTGAGQIYATPYTVPQDPNNFLRNDYGRSDLNITNRFVADFAWDVPWKRRSRYLGGWSLSGIFTAQSGQPFTIFAGPLVGELTQRANLNGTLGTTGNPNQYFSNVGAISSPADACAGSAPSNSWYVQGQVLFNGTAGSPCIGDSARNQFTGPAYVDLDLAVQKAFKPTERTALIFRSEFYNMLNRANYYNPVSSYSLDAVSTNPQFGEIKSAHNPRLIQLSVRMNW